MLLYIMRVLKHSILGTNFVLPLQVPPLSIHNCFFFFLIHNSSFYVWTLIKICEIRFSTVLNWLWFFASSHKNQDFLVNFFVRYTMHPLPKSKAQDLLLAKTMALDGRTEGDRNQNNAKHSNMYDCILKLFAQINHQFLKQRKLHCFLPRYGIFHFILLEVMCYRTGNVNFWLSASLVWSEWSIFCKHLNDTA